MEDRVKWEIAREGLTRGVLVFPDDSRIVVAPLGQA
jgi:hypothetical protein